jgi:response regulator RpfG family c-di-GMP phosphodiesterase
MTDSSSRILVVDDEPQVCELICAALRQESLPCLACNDPLQAVDILLSETVEVMVTDISMPGHDGLELLAQARRLQPTCRVILVTGVPSLRSLSAALAAGAYDYLTKPFHIDELRDCVRRAVADDGSHWLSVRAARALQEEPQLREVSMQSIRALVRAVEARDPFTRRHSEHVACYAVELARRLEVSPKALESIRTASLLHDCGKIGVSDQVLTKPGSLTDEEFALIKRHPTVGSQIISQIAAFGTEAELVRCHHERWDGRGYPAGLVAEQIPLGARIIHVADAIDAMLMERTYKRAYPVSKVIEELQRCCGTQFDPQVAETAEAMCRETPDVLIRPSEAAA